MLRYQYPGISKPFEDVQFVAEMPKSGFAYYVMCIRALKN